MKSDPSRIRWNPILRTTALAGVFDLAVASLQSWIFNRVTPGQLLTYIASGAWGETAFDGGVQFIFWGLIFHFMIVFACVFCFFALYSKWSFLQRSVALNAVLIALVAWLITTQGILRLSKIPSPEFQWPNVLISILVLVVCIGFPIALAAKKSRRKPHHSTFD